MPTKPELVNRLRIATSRCACCKLLPDHALAHLSLDDLFRSVLVRIREIMVADNIAILLLDEEHKYLIVRAVDGIEEMVAPSVRIPLGKGFAGTVAARCQPVIAGKQMPVEILTPILREQLYTLLGVPLAVNRRMTAICKKNCI